MPRARRALFAMLAAAWAALFVAPAHAQDAGSRGAAITLDGVSVDGLLPAGHRSAGRRLQSAGSVRIAVYRGAPSHAAGETRAFVQICGTEAVRTEVAFPAEPARRVQISADEPSAHLVVPPRVGRTYVHVTILRVEGARERTVTIEWSVPTARRATLRAAEDAFFASIRCEDAPG